ncbi:hypothetical protein Tco_0685460 [Tanacetum coccineum]
METEEVSEWYIAPYFENGLDAYDGEINLALDENLISNKFAVKLCLDYEMDKVESDGMIAEEEEEAINKVKGEALKEKDDLGAFIFPIRLGGQKSNSDDEEEYEIKRNKFGAPMYGLKPAAYLNCNDPAKRSSALQAVINPFQKISVGKKAVSSLGSLSVRLQHVKWKPDYKGCYTNKEEAKGKWRTEIRLTDPYGNIYVQAFTTKKTGWKLLKYHKLSDIMSPNLFIGLWEETMIKPDNQERSRQYETIEEVLLPQVHHEFLLWEGCNREANSRIKLREDGSYEEIFTSMT